MIEHHPIIIKLRRKESVNILFTSPGRRVELIRIFRENWVEGSVFVGTDSDETAPALYFLDKSYRHPYRIDEDYHELVLSICAENSVKVIIPLIDPELPVISKYREKFEREGIFPMVSSYEKIKIAMDKWETFKFAKNLSMKVPKTILGSDVGSLKSMNFPVLVKPRYGSASKGIMKFEKPESLLCFKDLLNENHIIQEFIEGYEVTVDIFGTEEGECIQAVQRRRLKVRGGEVERGVTQKDPRINDIVEKFTAHYKPRGVINVQFMVSKDGVFLMEINPRFGGGYPLSHHAGANFPKLLLKYIRGEKLERMGMNYVENFYMFRFDQAVYVSEGEKVKLL